jgi:hypothetical protein
VPGVGVGVVALILRLAADENFNNVIVRGLLRRLPDLDIVRVQDVGRSGTDDPGSWRGRPTPDASSSPTTSPL